VAALIKLLIAGFLSLTVLATDAQCAPPPSGSAPKKERRFLGVDTYVRHAESSKAETLKVCRKSGCTELLPGESTADLGWTTVTTITVPKGWKGSFDSEWGPPASYGPGVHKVPPYVQPTTITVKLRRS
jgi:hypothetical protein